MRLFSSRRFEEEVSHTHASRLIDKIGKNSKEITKSKGGVVKIQSARPKLLIHAITRYHTKIILKRAYNDRTSIGRSWRTPGKYCNGNDTGRSRGTRSKRKTLTSGSPWEGKERAPEKKLSRGTLIEMYSLFVSGVFQWCKSLVCPLRLRAGWQLSEVTCSGLNLARRNIIVC